MFAQNSQSLSGQHIIVTGASSGAAYSLVRRLAQAEGAVVIAIARRRVFRIEALAKQIGDNRIIPLSADMSAPGEATELIKRISDQHGPISAFVHGVNRELRLTALEVSNTEFDLTMQVNVKSALYGVQAVAPIFKRQGNGVIVIYNPTLARTPVFAASEAVYTAASHALSALASGWARQLELFGITVREIAPIPAEETPDASMAPAHDCLLIEALKSSLNTSRRIVAETMEVEDDSNDQVPTVLFSRGGLALTQY